MWQARCHPADLFLACLGMNKYVIVRTFRARMLHRNHTPYPEPQYCSICSLSPISATQTQNARPSSGARGDEDMVCSLNPVQTFPKLFRAQERDWDCQASVVTHDLSEVVKQTESVP